MDSFLRAVLYLAVGFITFVVLLTRFDLSERDTTGLKVFVVASIPLWPIHWCFLIFMAIWKR